MTTKTIEGLRELLETRGDAVVVPAGLSSRTADLARAARRRRRVAFSAGGLAIATLMATPFALDWPGGGSGQTEPIDRGAVSPDGLAWAPELPGLELPEGAPLQGTYARGDVLVINEHEVILEEPVSSFITAPDGAIVESGHATGSVSSLATHLDLVDEGGNVHPIDSGFIAGSAAAEQPDGTVLVAYGWLESATAETGQIRVRALGSDQPHEAFSVEPAATVRAMTGSDVTIAYLADPGSYVALLDADTGQQEAVSEPGSSVVPEGLAASGLVLTWDNDSQCLTAKPRFGEGGWQKCDGTFSVGVSPDGRSVLMLDGALDAETGERTATFEGLPKRPDLMEGMPTLSVGFLGWEDSSSAIYLVALIDPPGESPADISSETVAYVAVRCSLTTGACNRIPHPVDAVGKPLG